MGRKKLFSDDSLIRSFKTTVPLDDRLREEAAKKRISVSVLIREILERHYEER